MLELEQIYTRGGKTRFFLMMKYGFVWALLGALVVVLIWQINFGSLHTFTTDFLANHPEWFITISMLTLWLAILAFGFFLIGFLRGNLMFRHYKFLLDDHAFHLRRGLFLVKEITIPYHQISNVHLIRPYHYRFLGLAQIDIATASDRRIHHSKVKDCLIPMIDYRLAKQLSKQLISYADRVKSGEEIEDKNDEEELEYDYDIEDEEFENELQNGLRK
jgi:uncharacterized membrane protein YdbT with pleckstrin-like domain